MICLDTNIIIALFNGNQDVNERLKRELPDVGISSIVLAELLYGARASARAERNLEKVHQLLQLVTVLDFDRRCAEEYSKLKVDLRHKGRPTGEVDALIAAVALAYDAPLVTHNTKHFENIDRLRLEDWLLLG